VREGRPRPSTWPTGLAVIGAAVLVVYILLGLATIFAVPLRQNSDLLLSETSPNTLPESVAWLLTCGLILTLALLHTAALHTSWLVRFGLFAVGGFALVLYAGPAWMLILVSSGPPMATMLGIGLSVLTYLPLFIFTAARAKRGFVWWEFVVVTVVVALMMLGPWVVVGASPYFHARVSGAENVIRSLGILSFPALLVAGVAPAQIVVTGASAAVRRPISRGLFAGLSGLALAWLVFSTTLMVRRGVEELNPEAFAAGAIMLIIMAGLLLVWLARGRSGGLEAPDTYGDTWSARLYPLGLAVVALALVQTLLMVARLLVGIVASDGVNAGFDAVWNVISGSNSGLFWRAGMGVSLLVVAWRVSARGQVTEAALFSAFSALNILDCLGLIPGLAFLHERSVEASGLIAAGVAFLVGAIQAVQGRLNRERAIWLMTVVLLVGLFPYRDIVSDPAGAALVFSPYLLVLFGLTWRLITDAEFLEGDSQVFPRPTRVLLFIANTLFAATTIAFVALARAKGDDNDSTPWVVAGDWILGEPLYTVALVGALWLALRPQPTQPRIMTTSAAFGPPQANYHPANYQGQRPECGSSPNPPS
jgi:hypothetical protein